MPLTEWTSHVEDEGKEMAKSLSSSRIFSAVSWSS